jgi:DNA-binding response OmpR family regulator
MGQKIVLIEDDTDIAKLIEFKLEREGYSIHHYIDGMEGMKGIMEILPDLVILDVMLPKVNGFQILKSIRNTTEIQRLPVIMLTAMGREQDVLKAFKTGVDDYLVKPFRPAELIVRVRKALLKSGV